MPSNAKFPMPVDGLFHHPEALTFGPAPFGMLARLLTHFWMTNYGDMISIAQAPYARRDPRGGLRPRTPAWDMA